MNETNGAIREAARDVVTEIMDMMGVPPQQVEAHFGEGSAGAAIELGLTRFGEAILEQAKAHPENVVGCEAKTATVADPKAAVHK